MAANVSHHACEIDPISVERVRQRIDNSELVARYGRVVSASGNLLRVSGLKLRVGQTCALLAPSAPASSMLSAELIAQVEVIAIDRQQAVVMPWTTTHGIGTHLLVRAADTEPAIGVGSQMLGRVIDGAGNPLDGGPPPEVSAQVPIHREAPNPMDRPMIETVAATGIRAIDSLLTCGRGQRTGIFAAAGAGKSTLLGMLARGSDADINVIVLVGERGREVREFIEHSLGDGLARTVVVVATSDRQAPERVRAVYQATAIAEYFRDQGLHVQLLVDSITRFARALRDIGLAAGELPARRGYPPSALTVLPAVFERAGTSKRGAITAFYTVLVEDEQTADPVAEEVRSLLDGHIELTRALGNAGHHPAIDVLKSASRLMPLLVNDVHQTIAKRTRALLSQYEEIALLVQLGEYQAGSDELSDAAIAAFPSLNTHLRQQPDESIAYEASLESLWQAVALTDTNTRSGVASCQ